MFGRGRRNAQRHPPPPRDRRRAPRRAAGWQCRYVRVSAASDVHDRYLSDTDFAECMLRDLTTAGAGLQCHEELGVGDTVVLALRLGEQVQASIRVTGEVRHTGVDDDGNVHAGIEFVEVRDLERALLDRLVRDLEVTPR